MTLADLQSTPQIKTFTFKSFAKLAVDELFKYVKPFAIILGIKPFDHLVDAVDCTRFVNGYKTIY